MGCSIIDVFGVASIVYPFRLGHCVLVAVAKRKKCGGFLCHIHCGLLFEFLLGIIHHQDILELITRLIFRRTFLIQRNIL